MKAGNMKGTISTSRIIISLSCIVMFLLWQRSAYANVSISAELLGSSPPLIIGICTYGLAFVGVVLIEAAVFKKLSSMNWKISLWASLVFNLFSSCIGVFIRFLAFPLTDVVHPTILVVIVLAVVNIFFFKAPKYYKIIAVLGIIIGYIELLPDFPLFPPRHPILAFIEIIRPLLFGLGLSLWLEGLISGKFLDSEKRWATLIKANLFSYLFLIIMLVLFGPNPYSYDADNLFRRVEGMVAEGADQSEIITMLHDRRASTLYLLGLSGNDLPGPGYSAHDELQAMFIFNLRNELTNQSIDMELAIIDDTLQIPTLTHDATEQLRKTREYLVFARRMLVAIENSDEEEIEIISNEYSDWWNSNPLQFDDIFFFNPAGWFEILVKGSQD